MRICVVIFFYLVSVYIPSAIKEIKSYTIISVYISDILSTWDKILKAIDKESVNNFDSRNNELEYFENLEAKIDFTEELSKQIKRIENENGEIKIITYTLQEYVGDLVEAISKRIDIIERYPDIDPDLLIILNKIRTSTAMKMWKTINLKVQIPNSNPIKNMGAIMYKCNAEIELLRDAHKMIIDKHENQFWYKP